MKKILFVCTHNAGRSQMAEALFNHLAPGDVRAESAGEQPRREGVWPEVVEVMRELGIDLGPKRPKKLLPEMQLHADWAVTLACGATARSCRPSSRTGTSPTRPAKASTRCA